MSAFHRFPNLTSVCRVRLVWAQRGQFLKSHVRLSLILSWATRKIPQGANVLADVDAYIFR